MMIKIVKKYGIYPNLYLLNKKFFWDYLTLDIDHRNDLTFYSIYHLIQKICN